MDIAPAMGKFEAVCEYFMMFLFVRATKNQFRLSARACVVEFFVLYACKYCFINIFMVISNVRLIDMQIYVIALRFKFCAKK